MIISEEKLTELEQKILAFMQKKYDIETINVDEHDISDLSIDCHYSLSVDLGKEFGFADRLNGDELDHGAEYTNIREVFELVNDFI